MITTIKISSKNLASCKILSLAKNMVNAQILLQMGRDVKKSLAYLILILCYQTPTIAKADDFATFDWMTAPLSGLASLFSQCLEAPTSIGFNVASQTLNLANQGKWVSTGSKVKSGKLLRFDWSTKGIEARARKYLILYRIDPRFSAPQIYIQTYDYIKSEYVSDFHQFQSGKLVNYQSKPYINWSERITDYTSYFDFSGRSGIPVNTGDIINITLAKTADFFTSLGDFTTELDDGQATASINYTPSYVKDNQIIYTQASVWCAALDSVGTYSNAVCAQGKYKNTNSAKSFIVGKPEEPKFSTLLTSLQSCPDGTNTKDLDSLCYYDNGRGMKISIGGQSIKDEGVGFIHSNFLNKNFFYHKAESAGDLKLATSWDIDKMFVGFDQKLSNWNSYADFDALEAALNGGIIDLNMNYLHFGRYILAVEIGNGDKTILD